MSRTQSHAFGVEPGGRQSHIAGEDSAEILNRHIPHRSGPIPSLGPGSSAFTVYSILAKRECTRGTHAGAASQYAPPSHCTHGGLQPRTSRKRGFWPDLEHLCSLL